MRSWHDSSPRFSAGDGWWDDEADPGVRGIDQSIASAELLGIGPGTRLVRALVDLPRSVVWADNNLARYAATP